MVSSDHSPRGYLGVGWRFPLQVTPDGKVAQARHEQRVEESVYLVLATAKGERPLRPNFGCDIHNLLFAPNDGRTTAVVAFAVREALIANEPRIDVLDVNAEAAPEEPNLLLIRVSYRIRTNNAVGNLVYPFYLAEAG